MFLVASVLHLQVSGATTPLGELRTRLGELTSQGEAMQWASGQSWKSKAANSVSQSLPPAPLPKRERHSDGRAPQKDLVILLPVVCLRSEGPT